MPKMRQWIQLMVLICQAVSLMECLQCGRPEAYGAQPTEKYLQDPKLVLPWTVAVTNNIRQFKCLGSIIPEQDGGEMKRNGSTLILTAGNCFRHNFLKRWGSPSSYRVYAGMDRYNLFTSGGKVAHVKKLRIYPFNAGNDNIWHGVALVVLKTPLMFTKAISPVCLAQQLVPPGSSRCFVSTYVNSRLDEEVVDLVPGSLCNFGQFPELKKVGGICSLHGKASSDKHFGGPLVCLVNGRAYQFGIYLSQLSVKDVLHLRRQALHYYGPTTKLFSNDAETLTYTIVLGKEVSSSSVESSSKPTIPSTTSAPPAKQDPPVFCGNTSALGRTVESYVEGKRAEDMFPWNVIITTKTRGIVKCLGSVIHSGNQDHHVNSSEFVLTAADCFDHNSYSSWTLKSNMMVYSSSNKYAWYKRAGVKVGIVSGYSYGVPLAEGKIQGSVTLLRLKRPLSIKDEVIPVCLAPQGQVPPLVSHCHVTHYDNDEGKIDEDMVTLSSRGHCYRYRHKNEQHFRGLCTLEKTLKHYTQLGAPMVCIVEGRAYQYGVYLHQLSLKINDKYAQKLGFYSEISAVHDILADKVVAPPPVPCITKPDADAPKQNVSAAKPPVVFLPVDSGSRSSASRSEEQSTTKEPSVSVVLPSRPLPPSSSRPNNQPGQQPLQPVNGKSDSSSVSISKSKSASIERSSEESEERIVPPETPTPEVESPVLKRNETTIVVRFPQLTYPKFVIREETNEKPIIVSSGSSESEEIVIPITLPALISTPSPDTVPSEPVLSTPAPVKIDGNSKPSSHSRTTSASSSKTTSASGELIESKEEDIPLPKPGLPNIPCKNPGDYDFDIFVPSGLPMCPGNADGSVQLVPLPTPIPSAEYPSSSLESTDSKIYPSLPQYDMTNKTIAEHEHILIRDVALSETAVVGATSAAITGGTSSSHLSAVSGIASSGSSIYCPVGVSTPIMGTSGCTVQQPTGPENKKFKSTWKGVIQASKIRSIGSSTHESARASKSVEVIHGSASTPPGLSKPGSSLQGSTAAEITGTSKLASIAHGSTTTYNGTSISGGHGHVSSSVSSTGSSSSGHIASTPRVQESEGSSVKVLPGATGVHIFDVSMTSAEDVCTGSLQVRPGDMYSDTVVTSARCVWSRVSAKYKVYIGSLLPRHMTAAQFNRTLISVDRVHTVPFYSEHTSLKAMGIAVLKLKHKVKVIAGVESFPFPRPETAPSTTMQCFVSGVCQHGMPVRVEYQLLNPSDCWSRLGHNFLPNIQYCAIGRKKVLQFPVGAPLVCDFFGTWTQFGIYDHAPPFGKVDRFGTEEDEALNEVAIFVKLEGDSMKDMLKPSQS